MRARSLLIVGLGLLACGGKDKPGAETPGGGRDGGADRAGGSSRDANAAGGAGGAGGTGGGATGGASGATAGGSGGVPNDGGLDVPVTMADGPANPAIDAPPPSRATAARTCPGPAIPIV